MIILPRFIALCGNPGSGKSLVQGILRADYDVAPIDDGWNLRDYAIRHMGASSADVTTQEGKASLAYMSGEPVRDVRTGEHMTWRQVLGRIGNQFEALFGQDHQAFCALLRTERHATGTFSFGSVRRKQGWLYRKRGGVVVGIRAPWAEREINEFDAFDTDAVNYWLENDVKDEAVLREKVAALVTRISFLHQHGEHPSAVHVVD